MATVVVVFQLAFAQDDLDALLADLEGEGSNTVEKAAVPAPEKPDEDDAAEAEVKSESEPEAETEAKAEPEAEAAAKAEPEAEAEAKDGGKESVAEEKAEEEPKAEAEVKEEAVEEHVAEEKAKDEAEEPVAEAEKPADGAPATDKKVDEVLSLLDELAAETSDSAEKTAKSEAPAASESDVADAEPAEAPAAEKPVVAEKPAAKAANPDAELIENLRLTEAMHRKSHDEQAYREIAEARECMASGANEEAIRHYGLAARLMNDSNLSKKLRRECNQGIAEGLYRWAVQKDTHGFRDDALKLLQKAVDLRHPKAKRLMDRWKKQNPETLKKPDYSNIRHRVNDEDYKESREQIRKHLRRSRQCLAVNDMKKALEECEIVLVNDPYNEEAIRLRRAIQRKRHVILEKEREASRDGWIADVDEAWRPVYAVNAASLKEASAETVKTQVGEDPERTQEQDIEARMKAMRLPTISFKPPATIIDAVDFFRGASKDYDRPDIPIEKRGFNFVLKTPVGAIKQAADAAEEEAADDFTNNEDEKDASEPTNGLPPIPTITASDISFYDALKLVCDSVDYKFIVRGPVVMVMHKDMSTAEILSRKYNVPEAFMERVSSATEEIKTMGGFGSNTNKKADDESNSPERDWKAFFEELGVKWPEGSSIKHIKTLGKLYVRNTRENLAEFEKLLDELGGQPQLIEIETRFVEVSQEDLNSLGFEWILNSDYSLNLGSGLGKALGINNGVFGDETGTRTWSRNGSSEGKMGNSSAFTSTENIGSDTKLLANGKMSTLPSYSKIDSTVNNNMSSRNRTGNWNYTDDYTRHEPYNSNGARLIRGNNDNGRNIGINGFGGDAQMGQGLRYLSQNGNMVSGTDSFNNDQFMRVNAFLGAADLSLILHMLSQRSDTDLLSAPKVVTKSGENAVIKVVTEYIYPQDYDVSLSSSGNSGGSYGGNSSSSSSPMAIVEPQNFTMREVGVILDVTPTYSEANGGTIDLELKPQVVDEPVWHNYGMKIPFTGGQSANSVVEVPDFAGIIDSMVSAVNSLGENLLPAETKMDMAGRIVDTSMNAINNLSQPKSEEMTWYDVPMEQPFFHVRSVDSKVSITPGATVVMGGLITEQRKAMDDKIPFLGDLPFVGRIFRSHSEQTVKRNLLIFVTGRLITPSGRELTVNDETVAGESAEVKAAPKAE